MSHPDLVHLSLWLSPPPPGVAYYARCIYPCVSCLSVSVCLVCQVNQRFFLAPIFPSLFVSSPPDFDPCLSWLRTRLSDHSACSDCEPAYSLVLCWARFWFLTPAWPDLESAYLPTWNLITFPRVTPTLEKVKHRSYFHESCIPPWYKDCLRVIFDPAVVK